MHEITCSRSGLKFEWENKRKKVHPLISGWTSHSDQETRAVASAVIAQGKKECWETIEKFQAEISAALEAQDCSEPDPVPPHLYDFEGAWVAKLVGYSEKYGYEREFVDRYEKINDLRSQFYISEDGLFETCYKSRKGNETRRFIKIEDGCVSDLTQEELDQILDDHPQTPKELFDYSFLSPVWSGEDLTHLQIGDTYFQENTAYTIVTQHRQWIYEDGMSFGLADDEGQRVYGKARLATPEESLPLEKKLLQEKAIEKLRSDFDKTKKSLIATIREKGDRPTERVGEPLADSSNIYGSGDWFEVSESYILYCLSNSMDGDDWSRNNVPGAIAWRVPFDKAIAAKIRKLDEILKSDFAVPE